MIFLKNLIYSDADKFLGNENFVAQKLPKQVRKKQYWHIIKTCWDHFQDRSRWFYTGLLLN